MVFNYIICKASFNSKILSFPDYAFFHLKRKMNRIRITLLWSTWDRFSQHLARPPVGPPAGGGCRFSCLSQGIWFRAAGLIRSPYEGTDLSPAISITHPRPQPTAQCLLHGRVTRIGSIRHIPVFFYCFWKKEGSFCLDKNNAGTRLCQPPCWESLL